MPRRTAPHLSKALVTSDALTAFRTFPRRFTLEVSGVHEAAIRVLAKGSIVLLPRLLLPYASSVGDQAGPEMALLALLRGDRFLTPCDGGVRRHDPDILKQGFGGATAMICFLGTTQDG